MQIPVYKQELKDGLGELISANASIAYVSKAEPLILSPELELRLRTKAEVAQQTDLFLMSSILASVGWNGNDDVFNAVETFKARATPINKPFNYMHDETDIIGHMTDSAVIDNNKIIANTEQLDIIPEQFDILVHSVLYKTWAKQDLQQRMDKIIAEIKDGKWFVSMECLFAGFDYAIILPTGENKVIARNEQSSFLTKHLKVYGGKGEYEGSKVGRLLRNFTFSGKGLVDNPANKRSVIFTDTNTFNGAKASIKIFNKGMRMDEILKAQLDETKKKLEDAIAENKTLQTKANEEANKAVASKLETLEKSIADLNKTVNEKDAVIKTKEDSIATLSKTVSEKTEALTKLEAEVDTMKKEAVKAARLAKLASAGVIGDEAIAFLNKFASANEEMFDEVVSLKAAKKAEPDPKEKDKTKDKMPAKAEDITQDKSGEKAAAAVKVEETKTEETPIITPPVEDKTQALRTSAANWISQNILKSTAKLAK